MNTKRKRLSDEDGVIVIGLDELESKRRGHSIIEVLFWFLSHAPGVAVIWWGVCLHLSKRVYLYKIDRSLTGDEAVAFSWGIIGIGIWALAAFGELFAHRPLLKWLAYIVAGAVFIYGIHQSYLK